MDEFRAALDIDEFEDRNFNHHIDILMPQSVRLVAPRAQREYPDITAALVTLVQRVSSLIGKRRCLMNWRRLKDATFECPLFGHSSVSYGRSAVCEWPRRVTLPLRFLPLNHEGDLVTEVGRCFA